MKTATRSRKPRTQRPRPERKVAVVQPMTVEVEVLTVRVTVGDEVSHYDVAPGLLEGVGPCWLVRKVLASTYQSCQQTPYQTDVGGPFGDSCTCKGAKHRGSCKHQDFLRALIAAGKLPDLHQATCETCHGRGGAAAGDADGDGTCRGCGQ